VAIWKKRKENLLALYLVIKKKIIYLLCKLGYQKKKVSTWLLKKNLSSWLSKEKPLLIQDSLCLSLSLLGNQTIAYFNKNFILLLSHFGFFVL
jgi:hypothetical protein